MGFMKNFLIMYGVLECAVVGYPIPGFATGKVSRKKKLILRISAVDIKGIYSKFIYINLRARRRKSRARSLETGAVADRARLPRTVGGFDGCLAHNPLAVRDRPRESGPISDSSGFQGTRTRVAPPRP